MNKDIVITLPRHVALWLIVHCDRTLVQLVDLLHDDSRSSCHDWAIRESKYYSILYGCLNNCVSEREILDFLNKE